VLGARLTLSTFFVVDPTEVGIPDPINLSAEEACLDENRTTSEMENSKMKALYELTRLDCHGFSDDDESISEE
jgi:hypothetical protein